jgi:nitrate reductase gamma subunit
MHADDAMLHTAEVVHWIALAVMALVYSLRLWWLFRFRQAFDRSAPGAPSRTDARRGAVYSLFNVAMPWSMESTRRGLLFYVTFVLFHLGVVAGIGLAFVSTLAPDVLRVPTVAWTVGGLLSIACVLGVYRMVRRLVVRHMRLISTPDDYFSLAMLTVWFGLGVATQAHLVGAAGFESTGVLVAYLYLTSFFLLYVPFSKISHYLYYPFTRVWIGRTLGHRGSFPVARG